MISMVTKRHVLSSLLLALLLPTTDAFSMPQPRRGVPTLAKTRLAAAAAPSTENGDWSSSSSSSSTESVSLKQDATLDGGEESSSWSDGLDSKLVQEIKDEMLAKYLEQGVSREQAENEIEIFLSDKERSEKYLEMRAYAQAQADDLGIGFGLQLLAGFLIGFIGMVGPKYYSAYQAVNPEGSGGGPLPLM